MQDSDTVLSVYHKECRSLYAVTTVVLLVFSVVVLYNQETWASAFMFVLVTVLLWSFHWNAGRRIRNGSFGGSFSLWSKLERNDLERWLERRGGRRMPGANLPG